MTYVDGFVIPVPHDKRQAYLEMAKAVTPLFKQHGAIECVETWGDDLKKGHTTDFYMAVDAEEGENVVLSWMVWPDKETRDAAHPKVMADPLFESMNNDIFNGKRMFWGGFVPMLDDGTKGPAGYVDGFIIAVPTANKEAYRRQAEGGSPIFRDLGCTRIVECWGDDVPHGTLTDFYRAVKAEEGESIVFSWMEYPDKASRDKANADMMSDPRFEALGDMPFDGKRMIYSGFTPILQA